jgi:hypothetical protein
LAVYQTRAARRAHDIAEVQIAQLTGVISSALAQVRTAAASADAMVQRSKVSASLDELQNLARGTRAQLTGLATQLSREIAQNERR